jgi:hypothetical protein
VARRICGPCGDKVTGGWRKLLSGELRDLYSSQSTIRMIKSRRLRLAWHVAQMDKNSACRILVGKSKLKIPLGVPRSSWWIILKQILSENGGVVCLDLCCSRQGAVESYC